MFSFLLSFRKFISLLLVACILLAISNLIEWQEFFQLALSSNICFMMFAFALTLFWPIIGAFRWQETLHAKDIDIKFKDSLSAVMISFSANFFAPAKLGDFSKIISSLKGERKGALSSGVISERIADLGVLGLLICLGSFISEGWYLFLLSTIGLIILANILVFFPRIELRLRNENVMKLFLIVQSGISVWGREPVKMSMVAFWSSLNWVLASIQIYIFYLAFGEQVSFFIILTLFPITVLATLLPLTPGGLGVREASFLLIFGSYADLHSNVAVSLSYYLCSSGLTSLMGTFFLRNAFIRHSLEDSN